MAPTGDISVIIPFNRRSLQGKTVESVKVIGITVKYPTETPMGYWISIYIAF